MKQARVNDQIISEKVKVAETFFSRLVGLMFKSNMNGYDSLLIKKCNSIHTFFMRFSIDAVFLNSDFEIVKIYRFMKPWRMTRMVFKATQVLELKAGALPENVNIGDRVTLCLS